MQFRHISERAVHILLHSVMNEYISPDCCDENGAFEQRIYVDIADLSRGSIDKPPSVLRQQNETQESSWEAPDQQYGADAVDFFCM